MSAYRFCRTDDIGLLVDALNRCWGPYFPDEPAMTPAAFKRSIRDLQVWCSSCMVAFQGSDPIGVLIGAKRPSGTLIHKIAVHPDHRRQGHGRHLLTSLSSKLAILGPPRMVAEVPETFSPASGLFSACGYVEEALLTDYVWQRQEEEHGSAGRHRVRDPSDGRRSRRQWPPWRGLSGGLLDAGGRDPHCKEGRHRRARRRLRRANRGLHPLYKGGGSAGERADGGDCVAPHVHRGRWRPPASTCSFNCARKGMRTLRFQKVHPAEISKELLETLGFPRRRRASPLRREGTIRVIAQL